MKTILKNTSYKIDVLNWGIVYRVNRKEYINFLKEKVKNEDIDFNSFCQSAKIITAIHKDITDMGKTEAEFELDLLEERG